MRSPCYRFFFAGPRSSPGRFASGAGQFRMQRLHRATTQTSVMPPWMEPCCFIRWPACW